MSRLNSVIRRLSAQVNGLEWSLGPIEGLQGDVIEIGLGNGRTFDHLRELIKDRRIWVIDRNLQCHHSCVPPQDDFLQGDADEMLAELARKGVQAALVHYDLGHGDNAHDQAESARLSPLIDTVLAPGGVVVSGQPMVGLTQVRGPETVAIGRYFFYHKPR
ncbi:MAG: class I SAM-dependent methyltransferase [Pseudomonadota bacterium]